MSFSIPGNPFQWTFVGKHLQAFCHIAPSSFGPDIIGANHPWNKQLRHGVLQSKEMKARIGLSWKLLCKWHIKIIGNILTFVPIRLFISFCLRAPWLTNRDTASLGFTSLQLVAKALETMYKDKNNLAKLCSSSFVQVQIAQSSPTRKPDYGEIFLTKI